MLSKKEYEQLQGLCQNNPEAFKLFELLRCEHQKQLSMISHEIRNPVTLINSFLQLICAEHPEIKTYQYWDEVEESIQLLRSLLNELSDFNNSRKLNRKPDKIQEVLTSFVESIDPTLSEKGISLQLKKEGTPPPFLFDRYKLLQVFHNLARNASEAIGTAGGTLTITLAAEPTLVHIHFLDDGPGIPPEHQSDIFGSFVTHNKKDGTGLGLAICKRITEAHGGDLRVVSVPGKGADFILTLPLVIS